METNRTFYHKLADEALAGQIPDRSVCKTILTSADIDLMPLLNAAYEVRKHHWGNEVAIHILNNAANGYCPEDCGYCAQSKNSAADIGEYPLKSDDEILAEAKAAYENGAFRYCMVFSGRGPSPRRVDKICSLIEKIKNTYPLEICVSAGLMDDPTTAKLKAAGLDRMNHNLNTSRDNYEKICTTHTWDDRLNTLKAAGRAGLEVCSGMIVGMGEPVSDIIEVALELRALKARSIPINFLLPIEGNPLAQPENLTPDYCLRVLCLFRFLNPDSELRAAAGREYHLRNLEVLALYPANSIFLQGYLNTQGNTDAKTLQMIRDAGFTIKSDIPLDDLLTRPEPINETPAQNSCSGPSMKKLHDLRPNATL
jgi:biotin synthase